MNVLPLIRFLGDSTGTQWTVLYAGPLTRRMLASLERHIVFRAGEQQFIAVHDWQNDPLTDSQLRELLTRLQSS